MSDDHIEVEFRMPIAAMSALDRLAASIDMPRDELIGRILRVYVKQRGAATHPDGGKGEGR